MSRLLMIADDLTGALDAGVAFAKAGIETCVSEGLCPEESPEAQQCSVYAAVVPSRHMCAEEARRSVYALVEQAHSRGFTHIFKKTDSALRGNIGAELEAALAASGERTLYFLPAFPEMNRITRSGIQYIDGNVPVAQSVFGQDPFNPVHHSSVLDVIAETSAIHAYLAVPGQAQYPDGIAVFDARTQEDLRRTAIWLLGSVGARLIAGCAGLASALPEAMGLEHAAAQAIPPMQPLAVFCGSINPISIAQCDAAQRRGAPRFHLSRSGDADPNILAGQIANAAAECPVTVTDTGTVGILPAADAAAYGRAVAIRMGRVIRAVSEKLPDAAIFVIGGDTLIAFIQAMGIKVLLPVAEPLPGVVLAKYSLGGRSRYLLAKSGGFGTEDLLERIAQGSAAPAGYGGGELS